MFVRLCEQSESRVQQVHVNSYTVQKVVVHPIAEPINCGLDVV
jgi:hypothetical protein